MRFAREREPATRDPRADYIPAHTHPDKPGDPDRSPGGEDQPRRKRARTATTTANFGRVSERALPLETTRETEVGASPGGIP